MTSVTAYCSDLKTGLFRRTLIKRPGIEGPLADIAARIRFEGYYSFFQGVLFVHDKYELRLAIARKLGEAAPTTGLIPVKLAGEANAPVASLTTDQNNAISIFSTVVHWHTCKDFFINGFTHNNVSYRFDQPIKLTGIA